MIKLLMICIFIIDFRIVLICHQLQNHILIQLYTLFQIFIFFFKINYCFLKWLHQVLHLFGIFFSWCPMLGLDGVTSNVIITWLNISALEGSIVNCVSLFDVILVSLLVFLLQDRCEIIFGAYRWNACVASYRREVSVSV